MKTIYKKPVHNIFSTQKTTIKKEIISPQNKPKIKITIDYREKNSLVISKLIKLGFETEIKELKIGDYIVKDTIIERKTVSDFISSMINQRLHNQIKDLQQYENKLLIIEGIEEQELYYDYDESFDSYAISQEAIRNRPSKFQGKLKKTKGLSSNAVRGFLLSIILKHKIPLIFTKNANDTAKFISVLSKKKSQEISLNYNKKPKNKKEQLQFILEGFPGIGPKTSKKLLSEFKSIKNIINTSEKELKKILGKKAEIVKKIIEENYC